MHLQIHKKGFAMVFSTLCGKTPCHETPNAEMRGSHSWRRISAISACTSVFLAVSAIAVLSWLSPLPNDTVALSETTLMPGQPVVIVHHDRTLLPPKAPARLAVNDSHLTVAYDCTTVPVLRLRNGFFWKRSFTIIPIAEGTVPEAVFSTDNWTCAIPPLTIAMSDTDNSALNDEIPVFSNDVASFASSRNHLLILTIIGIFIVFTLGSRFIQNHVHVSPAEKITRLPCLVSSLDKLPVILAKYGISPKNAPEFFAKLDQARFAQTHPSSADIQQLLDDAAELLRR